MRLMKKPVYKLMLSRPKKWKKHVFFTFFALFFEILRSDDNVQNLRFLKKTRFFQNSDLGTSQLRNLEKSMCPKF